jgi:hypothetical protein
MSHSFDLEGQFEAWIAEGAKDLHNAIVPAFPDSQRGVDQLGTPLNMPSQIVTEDLKGGYEAELERAAAMGQGIEQDRGLER